jgi:hypothetical protein
MATLLGVLFCLAFLGLLYKMFFVKTKDKGTFDQNKVSFGGDGNGGGTGSGDSDTTTIIKP